MQFRVEYQDGSVAFEADGGNAVAAWTGPPDGVGDLSRRVREALEAPIEFPPLRRTVVPGDRVVVPFDRSLPQAATFLSEVASILREVGVGSITAIVDGRETFPTPLEPIEGVDYLIHDPHDRQSLAYLANTEAGRRIYLNRMVADADCVIPIGRLGFDDSTDFRGPWTIIEPGLGDHVAPPTSLLSSPKSGGTPWKEASEISWLLGCQFQIGGLPGRTGILKVLAGEASAVRDGSIGLINEAWRLAVEDRADLVIAGIGGPERGCVADDFAEGLRTALRSVRRGGKIALLSSASLDVIRDAVKDPALPHGDWEKALAWADFYLSSNADADTVDDLGFIPLDRPEQGAKLVASAHSFMTISQADRTRPVVVDG